MFILEITEICNDLAVLRTMRFIKNGLEVIKYMIPVILTIICMIDFVKALIAGEDKPITSKIVKRFVSAIIIFFVIPVINLFFGLLGEADVTASDCWNNANAGNIAALAAAEEAKKEADRADAKNRQVTYYSAMTQKIETAQVAASQRKLENPNPESGSSGSSGSNVSSTVNDYIYYNQGDYRHVPFCGGGKTVQSSGCGAASFAMIASNLVDPSYNPQVIANWMCSNGHSGGGLSHSFLVSEKILSQFGLNAESVIGDVGLLYAESSKQKVLQALNEGKMIILHIPGHYVVVASAGNNQVVWLNPGHRADNGVYTIDELYEKTKNYKGRCNSGGNCGWHGAAAYTKR